MKQVVLIPVLVMLTMAARGQNEENFPVIDRLLLRGEYGKAIDSCLKSIERDSLDSEIYFKLGLAYQNLLKDDKSLEAYSKALSLSPGNSNYKYSLARMLYSKNRLTQAEPLFATLCASDTLRWDYAYYLTSIMMQTGRYDESEVIYMRFLRNEPLNYLYHDKIGFAHLRKAEFEESKKYYNRSLELNPENTSAIKNLSYLYASTGKRDTAIILLTRGIAIDPEDMDLFSRRAQIYYTMNYTKRAMDDYLVLLASGDSSATNLKRAGIGYSNNLQPDKAVKYLLLSYNRDSSDYETASYLGQAYSKTKDMKNSIRYYSRVIRILTPVTNQARLTYILLAEAQRADGQYQAAIENYLRVQRFMVDPNIYMIIANIYDEQLNEKDKALQYYDLFLNSFRKSSTGFNTDYIDAIKKRIEYLKNGMVN